MGIRFLQTFMQKTVPDGVNQVDIRKEVSKYKKEYGKEPTIIIDVLALQERIYGNDHEVLLGGRYNVYNDRTIEMFSKIKDLGVNLIFFIDGPTQDDKISTCLDRRTKNYNCGVKILHAIDDGRDISQRNPDLEIQNLVPFFGNFISIASQFGDMNVSTLNECDLELANLATRLNALAIISNDTDFLIYEGDWRYWSSRDFNLSKLTTIEYNRRSLRDFLALSSNQMALFATLSGNDIVKYDSLKNFHHQIAPRAYVKFPKIADLVRRLRSTPPDISENDMNYLVKRIYSPKESKTGHDLILASLKSYNYNAINTTHGDDFLDKISKDSYRFNFIIIGNRQYILQLSYFDLSKPDFMSFYELIMQLVRPQMGILLHHLQNPNVTRIFYGKKTHEEPFRQYVEKPQYPEIKVPPIQELLFTPYGTDEHLDNIRWNLLCWQISSKINPIIIKQISKDNLINVLTIFYLFERKQITTDEADCLILANNCPDEVRGILKFDEVKRINGRDARLAFLFSRLHGFVTHCFQSVGLGSFCALITFDGLYFHVLRKKWNTEYNASEKTNQMLFYKNLRLYSDEFNLF